MEKEYDFSKATRGKFFVADATFVPPVHLEPDVLKYLTHRAEERGTSLNELVRACRQLGTQGGREEKWFSMSGSGEPNRPVWKTEAQNNEPF